MLKKLQIELYLVKFMAIIKKYWKYIDKLRFVTYDVLCLNNR